MILKGLKFNSFLAKNCKPSIYRALEKRVESQVLLIISYWLIKLRILSPIVKYPLTSLNFRQLVFINKYIDMEEILAISYLL